MSHPSSQGTGITVKEVSERVYEPEVGGDHKNGKFQTEQGSWAYEFTMVVTSYPIPVHTQARPKPNMERGGVHKTQLLAEELLATDLNWEVESRFSLKV